MREASTQIKMHIRSVGIINNNSQRIILNFMLFSFGLLAVSYVLILGTMVFNILERRNFEKEERTLSSSVADLELSYLSISNNMDLAFANSLGFKETKTTFATRKSLPSLSSIKISQDEI